jgi:hypothetical protein
VNEPRQPNGEQEEARQRSLPSSEDLVPSRPARESSVSASRVKGQAAWITKIGQIVGLAIGVNQGLLVENPKRDLVALAVVLFLGGQAVENLAFRVIDRLFDRASD